MGHMDPESQHKKYQKGTQTKQVPKAGENNQYIIVYKLLHFLFHFSTLLKTHLPCTEVNKTRLRFSGFVCYL